MATRARRSAAPTAGHPARRDDARGIGKRGASRSGIGHDRLDGTGVKPGGLSPTKNAPHEANPERRKAHPPPRTGGRSCSGTTSISRSPRVRMELSTALSPWPSRNAKAVVAYGAAIAPNQNTTERDLSSADVRPSLEGDPVALSRPRRSRGTSRRSLLASPVHGRLALRPGEPVAASRTGCLQHSATAHRRSPAPGPNRALDERPRRRQRPGGYISMRHTYNYLVRRARRVRPIPPVPRPPPGTRRGGRPLHRTGGRCGPSVPGRVSGRRAASPPGDAADPAPPGPAIRVRCP